MKRAEALSPLSRDHHRGLFVALRLKRAESASALEARDAFVEFWNAEGREHFRTEEEILLPAFARYAQHDHPAVARVLVEHVDLRRRGADIATADTPIRRACTSLESGSRAISGMRSAFSSR